jgi:hypothetical protein
MTEAQLTLLGVWISSALTIFIFSFLYKDNPIYKLGEHIFLGISVGYIIIIDIEKALKSQCYIPIFQEGKYYLIIPTIMGITILLRVFPKLAWLSRYSFAFLIGYGSGIAIPTIINTYILKQTENTVIPLIGKGPQGIEWFTGQGFNTLIIFIGVVSVLTYFLFSIEHKGVVGKVSKLGILFLMTYFGATYGTTVMGRLSLLYGRIFDLYTFSDKKYYYATPVILIASIIFLIILSKASKNKESHS